MGNTESISMNFTGWIFYSSRVIVDTPPGKRKPLLAGRRPFFLYSAEASEVKENWVQHSNPRILYTREQL